MSDDVKALREEVAALRNELTMLRAEVLTLRQTTTQKPLTGESWPYRIPVDWRDVVGHTGCLSDTMVPLGLGSP